ncbi:MAG: hypothetical protein M3Z83_01080 [Actinomycetota bacterium]|nr:hypothetical protein [Actinomycetota bacterium]
MGERLGVKVEHELDEPRSVAGRQSVQLLDERRSGEVLTHHDVVARNEVLSGERQAQPPGVQPGDGRVRVPSTEGMLDGVDLERHSHRPLRGEQGRQRRLP